MSAETTTPDLAACVLHTGYINHEGYGHVRAGGRVAYAHRAAWEAVHGPIPAGLEMHHVCENPACVNVAHLVAMTSKQHMALHAVTHCHKGHAFDAENTHVRPDNGRRDCRACRRARKARYRKAKAS